jgi:hypothetical protein
MSNINHVYPDNPRIRPPLGTPGSRVRPACITRLWALEVIDAPGAWLIPLSGPEQTVCIIDTGLIQGHPDLRPNVLFDETDLDKSVDNDGHGIKVAGIIAAAHNTGHGRAGVCPGGKIKSFKVGWVWQDKFGSSAPHVGVPYGRMPGRIAEAINLVYKDIVKEPNKYRILSISKSSYGKSKEMAEKFARRYLLSNVDNFLGNDGLLIVAGDNEDRILAKECFPAAIKQISSRPASILVTGSISRPTSIWADSADPLYFGQDDVDIYAPGDMQEVLNNLSGYDEDRGNSLAIPHVAGLAALLLRINPDLDGEMIARIIRETAEPRIDSSSGKPIRLVNAFSAALKVHNQRVPERPLAGYRVSMPNEFNEGTLEVNGEPVPVSHIGLENSFCRFTAPLDLDIHARLFKHPSLEGDGRRRCYWEGKFQDLLSRALPASRGSAWSHSAVDALRTVRLHMIAAYIYYPDRQKVLNASVHLEEKARGIQFEGRTDHEGYCIIPFEEPGKYLLSVQENGLRYEVELDLQGGRIYDEDIVLGDIDPGNKWKSTWAGDVLYQGNAAVFERGTGVTHEELERLVVYPGHLYSQDLYTASGSIKLKATSKEIDRETLIHKVLVEDDYIQELVYEEGAGAVTPDMMPVLSPVTIRAFSETVCRVEHNFSKEIDDRLRNWEFGAWEGGFGAHEKDQFAHLPSGLLVAAGEGELEFELALPSLIRRLLQARIQKEPHEQSPIPLWIDVSVHWCLDYSNVHGEGSEIEIASVQGQVHPASIPYRIEYPSQDPKTWRVVAGPARGILEFITHPKNPMKVEMETLSQPGTHISAIVQEPAGSIGVPREFRELWVLSSQGELSLIDPLSTWKQRLMQDSTALRRQKDVPAQQPQAKQDEKLLGLRQLEARQQREREQAQTFIELQRMGPQEAREHMEMIEERYKRQREELDSSEDAYGPG